ncbi:NAD(P)/FAD-dependent oxidoreductase [Desulfosporosinus sp. BICA1-9]|uniref:NAD(P)/FAD-dependent oxidoreductase n=1 Tax=Desulfosporosinus sp. BICA1-9 TaxID=1531958 RepID=UPI00054B0047|nr:FAD-dependent oxidoreductase [Desulfosporosinus sp. BICA1-9]KJS47132.1 MAG: pyridine nucleotide-disulfide oxidoreductase [Peptococcaceae bacterium BRH_c23]KJS79792.1 MAG: pyridine nucleotide-disulfide oxidoreductase [Desulfosporosinus sp. BICA1-9]HBW38179.1 NAD(P)/FAD-dependent oxidoreductase [Desulfosporosinus sp.]
MNYVIVGNSAAAIGAVEGIRSVDREGKISLFSKEPHPAYSRPLISYYLSGKVTPEKMYYRDPDFYERLQVEAHLGIEVQALRLEEKKVELPTGEKTAYDRLLIATGGKPISPPIPGREYSGVSTFLTWDDVKELGKELFPGIKVVVIGAGLIGLKATEALVKREANVTVAELSNRILSAILDEDSAQIVQNHLEEQGVKFQLNNTVAEILGQKGKVTGVRLQNGENIECDRVILAIGVRPNLDLVRDTEIKLNQGILINPQMATSVSDVYAAGDVSEGYDKICQENRVLPILPNAYKQGFNAGVNMAGGSSAYLGGFAMNAIGFFDLPMLTAGIIKPNAPDFQEYIQQDQAKQSYKKIVLRAGKLVGYIALNSVDRAGILTGLMDQEVDVTPFREHLLQEDFGYIHFPKELRSQRLTLRK